MSPSAAVSAARFHHQWAPNELLLEAELKKRVGEELEQRGHQVRQSGDWQQLRELHGMPTGHCRAAAIRGKTVSLPDSIWKNKDSG